MWEYFPLRTAFREELIADVEREHEKKTILKTGEVGTLKKNRDEKRMRKMARQAQLTDGWFGMK